VASQGEIRWVSPHEQGSQVEHSIPRLRGIAHLPIAPADGSPALPVE